jgi:NitT/TauT family transport system permease protein
MRPARGEFDEDALARAAARDLKRRARLVVSLRVLILAVGLGAWEGAARGGLLDPFFFAMPSKIAEQVWEWTSKGTPQGSLIAQISVTLEETVLGFLIVALLGVVFGVMLGRNKLLADVFSIYIKIANSVPRIVLGSIFVIAFGLGIGSKVALAAVMVFFVVFSNAFQGVRDADRAMIANARILGASPMQVTLFVVIPSAMSWILASLRVSFGFALVGAVVGELLGSRQGIGLLIASAQGAFNAAGVFAAMVVLALVAFAADLSLSLVENRLIRWRPPVAGERDA